MGACYKKGLLHKGISHVKHAHYAMTLSLLGPRYLMCGNVLQISASVRNARKLEEAGKAFAKVRMALEVAHIGMQYEDGLLVVRFKQSISWCHEQALPLSPPASIEAKS